jgi:lipoprotein NlpI
LGAPAPRDLGQFTAAAGDLEAALELALASGSAPADLLRQRAWLAGARGDFAAAGTDLAAAFRLEPASTVTAHVQGLLRFEEGDFAAAAAALDFHLEDQPILPTASVLLALARWRAGLTTTDDEVITLADRGRYLEPWPQAIAAFHAGRLARPDLLALARGDNADPAPVRACQAWFHLGQRALLEGNPERAARDFHRALRTGGTSAVEYRLALAELIRLARP